MRPNEPPHEFVLLILALCVIVYTRVTGDVSEEGFEVVWSYVTFFVECVAELRLVRRVILLSFYQNNRRLTRFSFPLREPRLHFEFIYAERFPLCALRGGRAHDTLLLHHAAAAVHPNLVQRKWVLPGCAPEQRERWW